MRAQVECPTPAKRAYNLRSEALTEAAVITHDLRRGAVSVYECVCGAWHLTSATDLVIPSPPVPRHARRRRGRRR